MAVTNYTFQCLQGANFEEVVTWKNAAGSPINNTGYSARMQVRKEPNTEVLANLSTANGKIELGGSNGEVVLALEAAETEDLPPGDYYYDLEMVSAGGAVSRIVEGIFSVSREVTKV